MKFLPSYPESKLQQWKENLVEGVLRGVREIQGKSTLKLEIVPVKRKES